MSKILSNSDKDSEKAGTDVSYYMDMVPEELVLVVGIECL